MKKRNNTKLRNYLILLTLATTMMMDQSEAAE